MVLAGGVPAFRKRNKRPGPPVVIGSFRQPIRSQRMNQSVLLRHGRDCRHHSIQQSVVFNFAHRALRFESAPSQKSFVSGLNKLFKLYRSGCHARLGYRSLDRLGRRLDRRGLRGLLPGLLQALGFWRSACFSRYWQPALRWPISPHRSSEEPARPTSIVCAPAKSRTSAPSPPACGGRGPASAMPAGRYSSSEGNRDPDHSNENHRIGRRTGFTRALLRHLQHWLRERRGGGGLFPESRSRTSRGQNRRVVRPAHKVTQTSKESLFPEVERLRRSPSVPRGAPQ